MEVLNIVKLANGTKEEVIVTAVARVGFCGARGTSRTEAVEAAPS